MQNEGPRDLFAQNRPPAAPAPIPPAQDGTPAPLTALRDSGHSLKGLAAPDVVFAKVFVDDLRAHGPASASVVRARHKFPPGPSIGSTIRHLVNRGVIFATGFAPAVTPEAHGRVERVWALVNVEGAKG